MIVAITGTPGTGKTSVAEILKDNGFTVVDFHKAASENSFLIGKDKERDTKIVDIKAFDDFVKKHFISEDIVFIEGHLSHLLKNVEKVILLRCHPKKLKKNLSVKKWKKEKIKENLEAEILDIILCEAVEIHSEDNVFEIDTTNRNIEDIASNILEIVKNKFKIMKKYKIGKIDWSEEILKDF
jgi:adenylate kinase